jgi:peptidoglycan/LPS O-acetylase OafA/YrhL
MKNTIHLKGLHGLRAIAVLAVIISHSTLALDDFGLDSNIFRTSKQGKAHGLLLAGFGVSIFFALSGFLITYLLLKENEVKSINIKKFYIRRALRIWPLYYLYIFTCLITVVIFGISLNYNMAIYYVFLAANIPYIAGAAWPFLAHYWSLGVEEQFYMFWPWIVKKVTASLFKWTTLLILLLIALKMVCWMIERKTGNSIPLLAVQVTRFHTMLIGALGSILYYQNNKTFISFTTGKISQAICWGIILLVTFNKFHVVSVLDNEIIAVVTVFLIMGQITVQNRIINLDNKICNFLGKISYGMYVIHPLLIFYLAKIIGKFNSQDALSYIQVYLVVVAFTIILAYLSYEFYEKRFLRIKTKYTIIHSSGTATSKQPPLHPI